MRYEVVVRGSNKEEHMASMSNGIGKEIEKSINIHTDESFDEKDSFRQLHSVIPKFDEDNEIEELYFIYKYDDPQYYVTIKTNEVVLGKEDELFTKHYLDLILKSNMLIHNERTYKINNIITDITSSCPMITIECEDVTPTN